MSHSISMVSRETSSRVRHIEQIVNICCLRHGTGREGNCKHRREEATGNHAYAPTKMKWTRFEPLSIYCRKFEHLMLAALGDLV